MKKLQEIADTYIYAGRGTTPAAIIQHASLPHQKKVVCNIEDLPGAALNSGLSHPAIILIGDVVKAAEHATAFTPDTQYTPADYCVMQIA
ncbi:MAG: hypothetical protein EOP54_27285 [Sphingobacteriales bacterium]|nr:MAG: hypothetical protein EOP54_27285 [Sphingobacteriales bacterium]